MWRKDHTFNLNLFPQADPAPELEVVAIDENGRKLPTSGKDPQPPMKTSRGWVSSTRSHFQTQAGVKKVEIVCRAYNEMGEASTMAATQMQCKISFFHFDTLIAK